MAKKESRYARILQELGFVKTDRCTNSPRILAMLERLNCGTFVLPYSPTATFVTDETGQYWELMGKAIDLSEFGLRDIFTLGNEPELAEEEETSPVSKYLH